MADILFVCVHNSGRSQMAEALFNYLAKQLDLPFRAESAGTEPAGRLQLNVIRAMRELGIDLSTRRPKRLTNDMANKARRIITMGCVVDAAACPAISIKGVEDWRLPDPKGRSLQEVRALRGALRQKIEQLIISLGPYVQ